MSKFSLAAVLCASLLSTGCAIDPEVLEGMRQYNAGAQSRQVCSGCVTQEQWNQYRRNNPTDTSARGVR